MEEIQLPDKQYFLAVESDVVALADERSGNKIIIKLFISHIYIIIFNLSPSFLILRHSYFCCRIETAHCLC